MERYEQLTPGITDRLLVTYEKQVDHRIELEKKVVSNDVVKSYIGQISAFLLSVLSIGGGIYLVSIDKDITGFITIFVPLASLIAIFITSQKARNEERKRKR